MSKSSSDNITAPGSNELVSALSQAASGTGDWDILAHDVAGMLATPKLDWESLSMAKEHVHSQLPDSATMLEAFVSKSADEAGRNASVEMFDACCAAGGDPVQMLREVRRILRSYLAFDVFTYIESYASPRKDMTLIRGRFAMDGDAEFPWPARWMEIPTILMDRTEGANISISSLEDYYEKNPEARALQENPVSQEYSKRGIESYVSAMRMDGGRVAASLTLGRRAKTEPGPFGDTEQKYLNSFRLELVLRLIGEAFERRTVTRARAISALFTPRALPRPLANDCVRMIGEGFELEYVGLFRVNRARGQFEIVAQYDTEKSLKVEDGFVQKLDQGMLGHVLSEGKALYARDVRTKPPPFGYKQAAEAAASAMCLPLRLMRETSVEIEWILDLESTQLDAFPPPEQEALKHLVEEIERALQLWFEARLGSVLLDLVDQGVVVLGEGTRIERANKAARRLLGLMRDVPLPLPEADRYAHLEAYGADRASQEAIASGSIPASGEHLRLIGPDGIERPAMAGASYHDDAFHRHVWLLGDVENAAWVGSLKYMEMAVQTVMGQAHGNLMLAAALLKRSLAGMDAAGPAYLSVEQALRCLTMAKIPYERVASVYDVISQPRRRTSELDLTAELLRFRDALPANEAATLTLDVPDGPLLVGGDPERLSFALRSLLGYPLSISSADNLLRARLTANGAVAEIEVVLQHAIASMATIESEVDEVDGGDGGRDQIAYAESRAHALSGHGLGVIRVVVEAHNGEIQQGIGSNGEWRVIVRLPISPT